MSVVKKGASALGKLLILIALAGAFVVGMAGVVYMSLQGDEIKVPEIVGKDLNAGEQELAALGLQIKKRAARPSTEKINTILEQLPKAGETVKTGQKILVVVSEAGLEGEDIPATIKKSGDADEDDTEKIEELISDKPKKSNKASANANSNKKKTSTTRDVLSNNSNAANSNSANSNSNSSNSNSSNANKNTQTNSNKTANPADAKKPGADAKPAAAKTPAKPATGGDVRPRKTP